MSKIAFVFPGQGAQYTGMAKDFYEKYAVSREVFESASKASGLDVKALCFEENDRLNITEYTQIAILTAEIAILRAVEEAGIRSQVNAGLSLGEYGALVASGVMKEEDAFTVVRKRGIFMQEAYPTGGAMSAVLGTDAELIEKGYTQQEINNMRARIAGTEVHDSVDPEKSFGYQLYKRGQDLTAAAQAGLSPIAKQALGIASSAGENLAVAAIDPAWVLPVLSAQGGAEAMGQSIEKGESAGKTLAGGLAKFGAGWAITA